MRDVSVENHKVVYRLCIMWGLVAGAWVVLQITTPLILKDIVSKERAPTWQGVFTATTAFSGMFFCGITGYLSDRVGRLEFLVPWVHVFFFSVFLVIYADVYKVIYPMWIARIASLSIPSTVLHAFLSDFLSGNALLESFSFIGVSFGGSLLVSSFVCGFLGWRFSRLMSLIFAALLAGVASGVSTSLKLPNNVRPLSPLLAQTCAATVPRAGVRSGLRIINNDTLLRNLIIGLAILRVGNVNLHMMLVLFVNYRLGWGLTEMSFLTGVTAFLTVISQILGVRFIISSNIVFPALFLSLAAVPFVSIGYSFVMTGYQLAFVAFFGSLTTIASTIFNAKITALAADSNIAGLALGTVGTLQNFIEIIAAFFFGELQSWAVTHYSSKEVLSGLPFIVNGVFMSFTLAIVLYSHKRYGNGRTAWMGGTTNS